MVTPAQLRARKTAGERLAVLTAYDYPGARLLDEAGVDLLLVGDSLGMVVLGHPDTTHVTLADMVHHIAAVARAKPRAPIIGDMPFATYATPEQAVTSARALVAAGANAVKLEGGQEILPQIRAVLVAGISVIGHLGMLPQRIREEGRYRIKGRTDDEAASLLSDALALEAAGVSAFVLELVLPTVAAHLSRTLAVPTIGIGSGPDCDGQVLVTHDLIGAFPWFTPKFAQPRAQVGALTREAAESFIREVKQA